MTDEKALTKTNGERKPINIDISNGIRPSSYDELMQFAALVDRSGLVPSTLAKGGVPAIAMALISNLEAGRNMILGLQDIAVINGKLSVYGDGVLSMIRGSGLFDEEAFEESESGEFRQPGWTFKCTVRRLPNGKPKTGVFTWQEAMAAGFDKIKEPSPWARFPRRMMVWKARQWVLRDTFGDILRGYKIAEEAMDMIDLEEVEGRYEVAKEPGDNLGDVLTQVGRKEEVHLQGSMEVPNEQPEVSDGPRSIEPDDGFEQGKGETEIVEPENTGEVLAVKPGEKTDYVFGNEKFVLDAEEAQAKVNKLKTSGILAFFHNNHDGIHQSVKVFAQAKFMKLHKADPPPLQPIQAGGDATPDPEASLEKEAPKGDGTDMLPCPKKGGANVMTKACDKLCNSSDTCEVYQSYLGDEKVDPEADLEAQEPVSEKEPVSSKLIECDNCGNLEEMPIDKDPALVVCPKCQGPMANPLPPGGPNLNEAGTSRDNAGEPTQQDFLAKMEEFRDHLGKAKYQMVLMAQYRVKAAEDLKEKEWGSVLESLNTQAINMDIEPLDIDAFIPF